MIFNDLHLEEDEPTTKPVDSFDFEKQDLTIELIKNEIYDEALLYHSSKAQKKYIKYLQQYPEGVLHHKYELLREKTNKKPVILKKRGKLTTKKYGNI